MPFKFDFFEDTLGSIVITPYSKIKNEDVSGLYKWLIIMTEY